MGKASAAGRGNLDHKKEIFADQPTYLEVDGHCVHCGKPYYGGPYGRWGEHGTCSKACETDHAAKERFVAPVF